MMTQTAHKNTQCFWRQIWRSIWTATDKRLVSTPKQRWSRNHNY